MTAGQTAVVRIYLSVGLPILFLRRRRGCLAAGMNGFLTKPIQPDALYAGIARWARTASDPVPAS